MLPYPSGPLHMGHVRNYTINDMMYRQLRMRGFNPLMPMGWDAFGLPAENAAIKNRVAPAKYTRDNIAFMKGQMRAHGLGNRLVARIRDVRPVVLQVEPVVLPQDAGEGHRVPEDRRVNWDPVDQTVLANEQVVDGVGWRSGAPVEKREIPMYYLKITDYAEELLAYLDKMPGWPERVKTMQANWIGKSVGVRFAFPHDIHDDQGRLIGDGRHVRVHHARRHDHGRDVLRGRRRASAGAAGRERPTRRSPAFIDECRRGSVIEADLATMEKKGMPTGLYVRHPITNESVEVWIANYVLMGYGDGAVMGVPGHDERDFAFARKYGLPIKQVIAVEGEEWFADMWQPWYADKERGRCVFSVKYDELPYARRRRRRGRRSRRDGPGGEERPLIACAIGGFPGSAIGGRRSRSSIAKSAAPCPCRKRTCPSCCRRTACRTAPAIRWPSAPIS